MRLQVELTDNIMKSLLSRIGKGQVQVDCEYIKIDGFTLWMGGDLYIHFENSNSKIFFRAEPEAWKVLKEAASLRIIDLS